MKLISTRYHFIDGTWIEIVEEFKEIAPNIEFGRVHHVTQTLEMSRKEFADWLNEDYLPYPKTH